MAISFLPLSAVQSGAEQILLQVMMEKVSLLSWGTYGSSLWIVILIIQPNQLLQHGSTPEFSLIENLLAELRRLVSLIGSAILTHLHQICWEELARNQANCSEKLVEDVNSIQFIYKFNSPINNRCRGTLLETSFTIQLYIQSSQL